MKLTELSKEVNQWFSPEGPMADVVISSRIRLARNLAGHKFLSKCTEKEKTIILENLKDILLGLELGDKNFYVQIDQASALDRNFLVERHLISRNHAFGSGPRGAIITNSEFFTAMINEEDHLRIQVLKAGLQLQKCYQQINSIDDKIEEKTDYAFSPKLGYLTACPTNLGTGIRVSVMLHLPALKMTGHIEKFLNAARSMNLAVRGLFGEGSDAAGDFYQLSNQTTLGINEQETVDKFEQVIIPEIVQYETSAREQLIAQQPDVLDDKISRALALLKGAHLISSHEALFLLSHIRLGINMKEYMHSATPAIKTLCKQTKENPNPISIETINRLFLMTQPAHLQMNQGHTLKPEKRDILRAKDHPAGSESADTIIKIEITDPLRNKQIYPKKPPQRSYLPAKMAY